MRSTRLVVRWPYLHLPVNGRNHDGRFRSLPVQQAVFRFVFWDFWFSHTDGHIR